ncbi:hypothetical protein EZS27_021321 [termite gut metagenome]|uniref:SPOR domain-containing protein n=1 Tax=termite gut metagenome TaxID=433724 RepID=A0A5J4R8C1_9ZZZZ
MKFYLLFFVLLFSPLFVANAQEQPTIINSLQQKSEGEGKVTIRQEPHIEALLGTRHTGDEEKIIKIAGYRIQVYVGNNSREAREEASRPASRIKELFPSVEVYTYFDPPHWICRVGDFPTIEEADNMMRTIKKEMYLKEVFLIKEQINIYL